MPRAGFATVAGKPNAGKSTLLNRIVGQKLSIVSPKPQSTRDRIVGIHSSSDVQIVLLDTPGLLDPAYPLQRAMRATAVQALEDADVIIHVADATEGAPASLMTAAGLTSPLHAPVIVALNKIDMVAEQSAAALARQLPDAVLISAATGAGLDSLLERVASQLPESPFLYPEEDVSTQTMRFFAAELVRETALEQLDDEIPYSVACDVEEFREDRRPVYIRAVLYVERESQKRILIGAKGARIRDIGRAGRAKIEELVGSAVYLDLWVKVLPNWRKSESAMRRFGYRIPQERPS